MNMSVYEIQKWQRCQELAAQNGVTIELVSGFRLTDKNGLGLGAVETVAELFTFLCGYDYKRDE